jgi:PAS domain-containing protein
LKLDTDLDGKITFVTKSFCEMSWYSKDEGVLKYLHFYQQSHL